MTRSPIELSAGQLKTNRFGRSSNLSVIKSQMINETFMSLNRLVIKSSVYVKVWVLVIGRNPDSSVKIPSVRECKL